MEVAETGKNPSCWKTYIPISEAGDKSIHVSYWEILCAMKKLKRKYRKETERAKEECFSRWCSQGRLLWGSDLTTESEESDGVSHSDVWRKSRLGREEVEAITITHISVTSPLSPPQQRHPQQPPRLPPPLHRHPHTAPSRQSLST